MKKLKALNAYLKSAAAKGSIEEYNSTVEDMRSARKIGRDQYLAMAGASLPTLGKLAETTGILPEGYTLGAVQKVTAMIGVALAAAAQAVVPKPDEVVSLLATNDLT